MLGEMRKASTVFYLMAIRIGVHAFIEHAGLLNEFIKICMRAEEQGIPWISANTHSGDVLPVEEYNLQYLAEKLDCIYGPALQTPENKQVFTRALLGNAE